MTAVIDVTGLLENPVVYDKLRKISLCLALGLGSLIGVPMRADKIEELMHQMREPKIAHTLPDESDKGDGLPDYERTT